MGQFSRFLKGSKAVRENYKYAASKAFVDEDGRPIEWELRPITTKEHETITEACTYDVPIPGKPNLFKPKVNSSKFISKIIATAVVYPNLNDKELHDSYGVMCAEDLVTELLDDPKEYSDLYRFINDSNGFGDGVADKVEHVKN